MLIEYFFAAKLITVFFYCIEIILGITISRCQKGYAETETCFVGLIVLIFTYLSIKNVRK